MSSQDQPDLDKYDKIEKFVKCFKLSGSAYKKAMTLLNQNMDHGLINRMTKTDRDLNMLPTFVRALPDGTEKGDFLALDVGGTNFRVLLVRIKEEGTDIKSKTYVIPEKIMLGTGLQLFDHIADCIGNFISEHDLETSTLPLGFTFSFPLKQESLAKARLTNWSKGFRCEGVIGEDVCQMLDEAVRRRTKYKVKIVAVVNDTVGTLMSAAHKERNCEIGLIVGTGCNACYMEQLDIVGKWTLEDDDEHHHPRQVIINIEWGAFGDNGCLDYIRTEYDREVDAYSVNPGRQLHEKMISGMYMGEIVRLVLERLTQENLVFKDINRDSGLFERGRFFTKYVSEIESDSNDVFTNTMKVLDEINVENYTTEDCKIVRYVCTVISARSAFLAAAGLATLINRIGKPEMTVGVDGSLYRFHPRFHDLMCLKIKELVKPGIKFKLALADDGSGKGAALTAAVAHRLQNMKINKDITHEAFTQQEMITVQA